MKGSKWYVILPIQLGAMLLLGALTAFSLWWGGTLHGILIWGVCPLAGAVSACLATVRGLNNYLAWIAPPAAVGLAHYIFWAYLPEPGPVLACAFVALVGAAAGDVLKKQGRGAR